MGGDKNNQAAERMFVINNRMRQQSGISMNLSERAITFYTKVMRKILKSYERKRQLTAILIFIECVQIISLLYNDNVIGQIQSDQQRLSQKRVSQICSWFKYFRLYPLFEEIDQADGDSNKNQVYENFSLYCALFNLILLGYIFLRFLIWIFIEYQDSLSASGNNILNGSNYSTVNTMAEQKQNEVWRLADKITSGILQCYSQVFAIPFCDSALQILFYSINSINTSDNQQLSNQTKAFGLILLITTLTLWILVILNDFDFSILEKDSFAQRNNLYKWLSFLFNTIFCGLSHANIGGATLAWICLIFALVRLITYFQDFPYLFPCAQKAIMLQNCLIFINAGICVFSLTNQNTDYSLLLFLSLPIGYKLNIVLMQFKENQLLPFMQGLNYSSNVALTNRYLRYLINLTQVSYEDYLSPITGKGVIFETLYTNHVSKCQDQSCFCIKYNRNCIPQNSQVKTRNNSQQKNDQNINSQFFNGLSITEMHGIEYRRQFIIDYLNSLFGKMFNFSSSSAFQFNNNQYQKEQSFNAQNIGSNSNLGSTTGMRHQRSIGSMIQGSNRLNNIYLDSNSIQLKAIYVYYLMQIAKTPAKAFTQIFELRETMIKDQMSLKSKYIVQSLIYDTFDAFSHFFCMPDFQNQRLALTQLLEFDHLTKDIKRTMLEGLQKKQNYYEYLFSDFIILEELIRQSEVCILQKQIIESQLLRLFDISPTHPKTFIIADIYIEYFDFKKRRIRNFVTRSRKVMNKLLRKTDRRVELFQQKSCGLFISFRTSLITKATYTAANIFSCQISDLLSKPLNFFIPDFLVKHTNKYLQALNEDGDMLWIQLGEYFSFIKNSKGYTIPVYIRAKLDIVDGNDFGLTIYIQQSHRKKEYIICDSQFQYLDSTKNITKILTKSIKAEIRSYQNLNEKSKMAQNHLKKMLRQINLRNLIPFLLSIEQFEEINDNKDFNESLGFKDQQSRHFNTYTSTLAIPVNSKQIHSLGQQIRLDAYEIDKYFCTYPSDHLQFLEISFSVLRQKSYHEPEKYIHFIEIAQIRRFRKQAEINDYITFLNEKLTKQYQSPIQIPLLKNSVFYYRPPRPPTVMLQLQGEIQESQLSQLNQEISTGNNSPAKANSPSNLSETFYDNFHNYGESAQKVNTDLVDEIQLQSSLSKQKRSYFQSSKSQENKESSRVAKTDLNRTQIANFQSNQAINQYNQLNLTQQGQQAFSYNQLFFSPRSEDRIFNGQIYTETNIQISNRELSLQDNNAKQEDDYLNQLLSQTQIKQIHSSKNQQEIFSPVSNGLILSNQQINENEINQNTTTAINNYKNYDSFTMSNSLLSPELRRPLNRNGKSQNRINNLSQIDDSYVMFNGANNNKNTPKFQDDSNQVSKQKLIKLQAPLAQQIGTQLKRPIKKNLTNVNVNVYEDNDNDEEEDDELRQQQYNKTNVLSLKDIESANDQQDGQGEFAFQNNNSEDSEDLKKQQRDIIRDDSSVRSGESQFYSKKVNIFDIIINKREPPEMIYIKTTGFISFLILMVLTFVLFLQLKANFNDVWQNFTNLQIGPNAIEQYAQILRNYEISFTPFILQCYTQIPIFPPEFRAAVQLEGLNSNSQFLQSIDNIQKNLLSQQGELQDYFFKNITTIMYLTQINQDDVTFAYSDVTRGQSILYLPYHLKAYYTPSKQYLNPKNCLNAKKINNKYSQAFTYQNYDTFIDSLIKISDSSQNEANDKLQSTKQLLIFSVILVEVISSIIVLVIFPVHYTIQVRKEEILKLLCTYNSEFISTQITRYKKAQYNKIFIQDDVDKLLAQRRQHSNGGTSSANQISLKHLPNQTEKKKRTISQTNSLNRFSLKLSFRTFFIFIILSLNPILNIFLMRGFFENFSYNIQEYSITYLTKSYVSLNYISTYLLINFPYYGFKEQNRNKLLNFINVLKIDGQQRLQTFYEMDKNFQVERYQIDEYKLVFLRTLKEDACQILLDNQDSGYEFNQLVQIEQCQNMLQGKLKNGMILGIREIYDKLTSLQEMFLLTFQNLPVYMMSYIKWEQQNDLKDLDTTYYYLRDIINLLTLFIHNKSQDYFDYLITVQLILFVESLIIISVIFLFIGYRFIKSLGSTIYNTTFLFTLLPIDSLIENPYIFNYLSNERRRNKGK